MILITRPHEEAKVLEKELLKIGKECVTDSLISFKFHFKKIPFEKNVLYLISSSQSVKVLLKYKNKYRPLLKNGTFIVVGKKVATELTKIDSVNQRIISKINPFEAGSFSETTSVLPPCIMSKSIC